MNSPKSELKKISFTILLLVAVFLLLLAQRGAAVTVTTQSALIGAGSINPGDEVLIYTVGLQRNPPSQEQLLRISIVIEDLAAPTGLANTDFTALRLWEDDPGFSANAWDTGDNLLGTVATGGINIGAETDIDATVPASLLPGGAARLYFVTAIISPTAAIGHSFRLGTLAASIDIDTNPPGPGGFDGIADQFTGGAVASADNNRLDIVAGGGGGGSPVLITKNTGDPDSVKTAAFTQPVPFGGEWLFAALALGFGAYIILRKQS